MALLAPINNRNPKSSQLQARNNTRTSPEVVSPFLSEEKLKEEEQ